MSAYVDRTRNMFGALNDDCRARLEAVLTEPTQETWEQAYSLIISERFRFQTLWQAWIATCPDAPLSKPLEGPWPRIPTQIELYRALREATGGAA